MEGLMVQKTTEMGRVGKTMLIYGESGVGKSTALGTLNGRTLIIDVEGGLTVLRGHDNVDRVSIPESLANLKAVFDAIASAKTFDYDNVCLDSATELQQFMLIRLAAMSKNDGMPSLHDYGVVSFKMRDYMRQLRDLRERGVNVVVTALEMPLELEQSDNSIRTRLYPMLAKKLAPEVCGLFDIVARLSISQKEGHVGERFFRLDGDENFIAKFRYGQLRGFHADIGALFDGIDTASESKAEPKKAGRAGRGEKGGQEVKGA